ncbi:eukaryotic translation initiation factor 2-alpha kinase 1-like [Phlebotomus papatasi]|uniref:eukaryotic translation initiation factor 2-alpha kinase 1-like n=1 Tax=Phlebotomus papatasi TaxID=29031 RepID=UPI0024843BFA|nr:eukaryotic translation initiation factor 2-alpha kinase 1-like [Phlebotomus papatasi]
MEKKIGRPIGSPVPKKGESGSCRYTKEFDEISQLGSGNYGKVFLVRNRLDNINYAIKKVSIKSSDKKKILLHVKEVHILARLNHQNIVSYKTAWIKWNKSLTSAQNAKSVSISQEVSTDNTSSDSIIFADSSRTTYKSQSSGSTCRTLSSEDEELDDKFYFATLYIQMSLCDKTLTSWLKDRNSNFQENPSINYKDFFIKDSLCIFKQLTKGLNYIHEMKIVHHDINPNNIFMSMNNYNCKHPIVQLGDFGLASYRREHSSKGGAMGTIPYSAPEQRRRGESCYESDLYSLGVIFLELLMPINTITELIEVIGKVKIQEQLQQPFDSCLRFRKIKKLIGRLLSDETENRPTANSVIKIIKFTAIVMQVNCDPDLKVLREKDRTIRILKDQVNEQAKMIKNLTEARNGIACEMPSGPRRTWNRETRDWILQEQNSTEAVSSRSSLPPGRYTPGNVSCRICIPMEQSTPGTVSSRRNIPPGQYRSGAVSPNTCILLEQYPSEAVSSAFLQQFF